MLRRSLALSLFIVCINASCALAQLAPSKTDALSKLQASQNAEACSATEASSCAMKSAAA